MLSSATQITILFYETNDDAGGCVNRNRETPYPRIITPRPSTRKNHIKISHKKYWVFEGDGRRKSEIT
jgi:hypothetical protein